MAAALSHPLQCSDCWRTGNMGDKKKEITAEAYKEIDLVMV